MKKQVNMDVLEKALKMTYQNSLKSAEAFSESSDWQKKLMRHIHAQSFVKPEEAEEQRFLNIAFGTLGFSFIMLLFFSFAQFYYLTNAADANIFRNMENTYYSYNNVYPSVGDY